MTNLNTNLLDTVEKKDKFIKLYSNKPNHARSYLNLLTGNKLNGRNLDYHLSYYYKTFIT